MIVAVDAMGGDFAPAEIVKGAARGSRLHDVDVVLVGDRDAISRHMPSAAARSGGVTIKHASETIGMDEHAGAVRTKRDASVVVAAALVADGSADAMVSLGNTAAALTIATVKLRRIEGIDRPAIAIVVPGKHGPTILLDAGGVVDCTVDNLKQFAVMGSVYAERVFAVTKPRIALLSVGQEKSKGSELTRAAHEELAAGSLNFVGNVEGQDLFSGVADVVVSDGFAGNVALKAAEGLAEHVMQLVRDDLRSHPLAWIPLALLKPTLKRLRKKLDYSEYGGAPLLGLNEICIIGHGRSRAHAVASAVGAAKEAVSSEVVGSIRDSLAFSGRASPCPVGNKEK